MILGVQLTDVFNDSSHLSNSELQLDIFCLPKRMVLKTCSRSSALEAAKKSSRPSGTVALFGCSSLGVARTLGAVPRGADALGLVLGARSELAGRVPHQLRKREIMIHCTTQQNAKDLPIL